VRVIVEVQDNRKLRILIEDDGVGFSPKEVKDLTGEHFGLSNLKSRVRLLKGRLRIISSPGKGTRLQATIPLEVIKG
ncbi:MAG TPA: histidine kinase, partial [Candidatus Atribacteria bacterium]|nr:histidine kinase [Candidatus Atribacteria bacterium]